MAQKPGNGDTHTHTLSHTTVAIVAIIVAEAYGVELIDTQVKAICLIVLFFFLHFQQ
jgi:hypothetical protein